MPLSLWPNRKCTTCVYEVFCEQYYKHTGFYWALPSFTSPYLSTELYWAQTTFLFKMIHLYSVTHPFPLVGLFISQKQSHPPSLFGVWLRVNLTVWSGLHGVRWCTLSTLGGPPHWGVPSQHPFLADHPDSDGWTVLDCHSCRKAPAISPPC